MSKASSAILKLRRARRAIVETAACWQARGFDTEPLNLPLIQIQEALADLESMDLDAEAGRQLRALAAELRNHLDAVRVSGAGLETEDDAARRVRWLDLIEDAADRCIRTIDRMQPLTEDE